jgi:hypothetical protein
MQIFSGMTMGMDIHAISTNLPCDVGVEDLLIGANQRIIASSI